ncbi:hypothetical protein F4804DRAFT_297816 [Jackrogersella minutella]|nr:hypothetical protein F4804DRAFT_297816 [Jackrogersella minutella]
MYYQICSRSQLMTTFLANDSILSTGITIIDFIPIVNHVNKIIKAANIEKPIRLPNILEKQMARGNASYIARTTRKKDG